MEGRAAVVAQTLLFRASAMQAQLATVDGRPGIVVIPGGRITAALVIVVEGGRIVRYDVVADPTRMARLNIDVISEPGNHPTRTEPE